MVESGDESSASARVIFDALVVEKSLFAFEVVAVGDSVLQPIGGFFQGRIRSRREQIHLRRAIGVTRQRSTAEVLREECVSFSEC